LPSREKNANKRTYKQNEFDDLNEDDQRGTTSPPAEKEAEHCVDALPASGAKLGSNHSPTISTKRIQYGEGYE